MKLTKLTIAAAALLGAAFTGFQTASAEELPGLGVQSSDYFYTGKPYDEDLNAYVFAFRDYDPEAGRWTTEDPSGFPDGTNSRTYVKNSPYGSFDPDGLKTGLIAGLDITIKVYRDGEWKEIQDGGTLSIATDTRFALHITNDPYSVTGMLNASNFPLGGFGIDKTSGGRIFPAGPGMTSLNDGTSGGGYWAKMYWTDGSIHPNVKLDANIAGMKKGGDWTVNVIYDGDGDGKPASWTGSGKIVE